MYTDFTTEYIIIIIIIIISYKATSVASELTFLINYYYNNKIKAAGVMGRACSRHGEDERNL